MRLRIEAPAKINLSLLVGPRRPDGYHDLFSVFMPVALCDRLEFDLAVGPADGSGRPGAITLDRASPAAEPADGAAAGPPAAAGAASATSPDPGMGGEDNLVVRALRAVEEEVGRAISGTVSLEKHIPVGAGMGGGSSDAAAALRAAARLLREEAGVTMEPDVLPRLAVSLGADVPFFLETRPAIARGIGEVLRPIELPRLALVLLLPEQPLSTAAVFAEFDRAPVQEDPQGFVRRCAAAEERWQEVAAACAQSAAAGAYATASEVELIAAALENDLEAPARSLQPDLGRAGEVLIEAGAVAAGMSGSGPTFFGPCRSEAHADEVVTRLAERGYRSRAVVAYSRAGA